MKIAIIGSGISGLSAAYYSCKFNLADEIHIFEKDNEIGGHSKSFNNIELGFQVFNKRTYPNFLELLEDLDIEYIETDMSFSVKNSNIEYGCKNIGYTLLHNSKFRTLLFEINCFYNIANTYLKKPYPISYADFCEKNNISIELQNNFILPLISSIWSIGTSDVSNTQMIFILNFLNNHGLLGFDNEQWYILKNGSREYKQKITSYCSSKLGSRFKIMTEHHIQKIEWKRNNVYVDGELFDKVVIGTPCDIPKRLLYNKTELQSQILDHFETINQQIYVHRDITFMPFNTNYWSSWNFIQHKKSRKKPILTYWMRSLQHITDERLFVTLNPPIKPANMVYKWTTTHPKFNTEYKNIHKIQGIHNIYYVGAYLGYHFHEDGVKSALNVINLITNKATIPVYDVLQIKPKVNDVIFERIFFYILKKCIKKGHLIIYYKNNKHIFGNPSQPACYVTITNPAAFRQILINNDIGLGESYMNCWIVTNHLTDFMNCIFSNYENIKNILTLDFNILNYILHYKNNNTIINSKSNIEYHYDLGNDFYKLWLDETMTYSCGIFDDNNTDDLKKASLKKYDRIIDTLQINSDDTVLEIGCGWGGFIKRCIERTGCKVTGITLSNQQYKFCNKRGYNVKLIDYRDMTGIFTKIVSIEMIEAVGADNHYIYFNKINNLLTQNGCAMIQAICYNNLNQYNASINCSDFIKKYIFPGCQCVCLEIINNHIVNNNMKITDIFEFGLSYATTLDIWQKRFNQTFSGQFDDRFKNMWNFYLSYCSAAFTNKLQCVKQIAFMKY
jgi:cyclopropane-fatty-acyl-phospholipid synthase